MNSQKNNLYSFKGLKDYLASNANVNQDDVLNVKKALASIGMYKPTKVENNLGKISSIPNQELFDSILEFQKKNSLFPDSIMKPEGETENKLKLLANASNYYVNEYEPHDQIENDTEQSDEEDLAYYVCSKCGAIHGGVYSPNLCHWCFIKANA
ncbi:MAG: hypothetical protein AB7U85_02645 [Alphaproteobacteria bacterium]